MSKTKIRTESGKITLTWINCPDRKQMDKYRPCTQVYGVCFNSDNEILVIDEKGDGTWKIIGGTPETGETAEQTLTRELLEEADVKLAEIIPVGVQKVEEFINSKDRPRIYYQWRFAGRIEKLYPQSPDPDTGKIYRRKLVPAEEINDLVKWGDTGRALFAAAKDLISKSTNQSEG